MEFNEYQKEARKTAFYRLEDSVVYPVLGLCSEAGEVAGKIKKILRDNNGFVNKRKKDVERVKGELGDVLWYLAVLSEDLGFSLEEVAQANLEKLKDRQERGKLGGSGDER